MGTVVKSARASVASTGMHKIGAKVVENVSLLLHAQLIHKRFETEA